MEHHVESGAVIHNGESVRPQNQLKEREVSGAGNRKKFGDPLYKPENDGIDDGHGSASVSLYLLK